MGEPATLAAAVETTAAEPVTITGPQVRSGGRGVSRNEARAGAMKNLRANAAAEPAKPAAVSGETLGEAAKTIEPVVETKSAEETKPDPVTDRGLRAVEQARKKFLDEQRAAKAERDVEVAEIARLRKEADGKVSSIADLKKMKLADKLDALELDEGDHEALSRLAYARTKAGKADPRAAAAAEDAQRSQAARGHSSELAELRATVEALKGELKGEFTKRDQASFAERWVSEAVKAVPSDKATLFALQLAKSPDGARRELLLIGAELEKANDGDAPSHAEVLAEFDKRKRAQLEELGVDVDELLKPKTKAATTTTATTRTLEVAAPRMTRAENAPKDRAGLRANALSNLRARQRTTADQS